MTTLLLCVSGIYLSIVGLVLVFVISLAKAAREADEAFRKAVIKEHKEE